MLGSSHGRDALGGAGGTQAAGAAQGQRVGVGGLHARHTRGQLHRHQPALVVGANPLVRVNKGGVQDRFLQAGHA